MGFVKSGEELDKYYGLGVRRFSDAKMVREGRYVNARLEYLATRDE